MFNFLSWNCRGGASNRSKQDFVKTLIRKHHLNMFVLFETKVKAVSENAIRSFWGHNDFQFFCVPSQGFSGGIVVSWNSSSCRGSVIASGVRWCVLENTMADFSFCILCVYGSPVCGERNALWNELGPIIRSFDNVIVCGNFNDFLLCSKRSNLMGSPPSSISIKEGCEWLFAPDGNDRLFWRRRIRLVRERSEFLCGRAGPVVTDEGCPRCGEIETVEHALFHCRVSRGVWAQAFKVFGAVLSV